MLHKTMMSDSLGYGLAFLLNSASGLVLLPIYLKLLTPAEFGVLDTLIAVIGCASFVTSLGAPTGVTRIFFDRKEVEGRKSLFSSVVFFLVGSTVLAMGLLAAGHPILRHMLGGTIRDTGLLLYCLPLLPLQILSNISEYLLRCRRKSGTVLAVATAGAVLKLVAAVLLVSRYGLKGGLIASWVPFAMTALAGLWLNREYLGWRFSAGALRSAIAFGAPLVSTTLLFSLLGLIDRAMVARTTSADALGLYSLAAKFIFIYTAALAGLRQAWGPIAFEQWNRPDFAKTYRHFVTSFAAAGVSVVACIAAFTPEGMRWFAPGSYSGGSHMVPWFLLGALFVDLLPCAGIRLMQSKRMGRYALVVALGVASGGIMDYLMIPRLGLPAVAFIYATSRMLILMGMAWAASREDSSGIEWSRILLLTGSLSAVLAALASADSLQARVAVLAALLMVAALVYRSSARNLQATVGANR